MLSTVTFAVLVGCAGLAAVALFYALRDRLIDDFLLAVAGVLELGLLAQTVVALTHVGEVKGGSAEQATFIAYAVTLPLIPPAVAFLAIKEKTRWSMGVIVAGVFAVAVMTGRIAQIWKMHG